jgi:DNA-binding MurR/RpiR family transcriptional regulator
MRASAPRTRRHALPFVRTIEARQGTMTRAERVIAGYLRAHARELPFETAASIARKVGVSPMTVGRFLRSLGYDGFPALKAELSSSLHQVPWLVGERYARMTRGASAETDERPPGRDLARSLDLELRAVVGAYELARSTHFAGAAQRVARADRVFIAGFQTVRGVAMDCAQRLEYARPNVRFLDGANGTYAELFADGRNRDKVLVIVEMRRYARQAVLLAREASTRGVHLVAVTDAVCHWAAEYADDLFQISTDVGLFWDSNAPLTTFLNLLVDETIRLLGPAVGKRIEALEGLQGEFEAFTGSGRQTA